MKLTTAQADYISEEVRYNQRVIDEMPYEVPLHVLARREALRLICQLHNIKETKVEVL